jgi:hypothetical protein
MTDTVKYLDLAMLERLAQPIRRIRTDCGILAAPEEQSWDIRDSRQRRFQFRKIVVP